jgi:hypothetical protein
MEGWIWLICFSGGINESTRAWVAPVEVAGSQSATSLSANTSAVFTMSYEQRAVDLDTLAAPEGHVLTGIKLRRLGGHLNLEIQVTNTIKKLMNTIPTFRSHLSASGLVT